MLLACCGTSSFITNLFRSSWCLTAAWLCVTQVRSSLSFAWKCFCGYGVSTTRPRRLMLSRPSSQGRALRAICTAISWKRAIYWELSECSMMKSILRLGQEFIFTNQETSRNPPCSENWFARIQSDAMLSLSMLSAAVVLILSGLRPAFALPTDNAALLPRTVPADTIDKYTVAVSVSNRKCYQKVCSRHAIVLPGNSAKETSTKDLSFLHRRSLSESAGLRYRKWDVHHLGKPVSLSIHRLLRQRHLRLIWGRLGCLAVQLLWPRSKWREPSTRYFETWCRRQEHSCYTNIFRAYVWSLRLPLFRVRMGDEWFIAWCQRKRYMGKNWEAYITESWQHWWQGRSSKCSSPGKPAGKPQDTNSNSRSMLVTRTCLIVSKTPLTGNDRAQRNWCAKF